MIDKNNSTNKRVADFWGDEKLIVLGELEM